MYFAIFEINVLIKYFSQYFKKINLEREREKHEFAVPLIFTHSLLDSCVYLDPGWNLQPWHIQRMI